MAIIHDAQLDLPAGAFPPDSWNLEDGNDLNLNAVISRDEQGNALSVVGDFIWNWTYYTPRKTTSKLIFTFWVNFRLVFDGKVNDKQLKLVRELQRLMFLRIYNSERILGFKSLNSDLSALKYIARFAEDRDCSIRDVFERTTLLDAYINTVPLSRCKDILRWLTFLGSLDPVNVLGFELAKAKKMKDLLKRVKEYEDSQLQTAPIPTRIYLQVINALGSELDDIEIHQEKLLAALREALILRAAHIKKYKSKSPDFGPDLIKKHGLETFLLHRGLKVNLSGLAGAVTSIMRTCKLQIHTFSGMRDEEAEHLPFHCMESVKAGHGRSHSLIVGFTTKLAGSRRMRARWVTTAAQGFRAIRIAQSFASLVYDFIGVTPSTKEDKKDNFPLFVSPSYLPWIAAKHSDSNTAYKPAATLHVLSHSRYLKAALSPIIEKEDLDELDAIDSFRDWSNEPDFAIGQPWPLRSHQLRRSLALYGNASGLVQNSSLRRQLQHLTREMTEFYGRGSVFAKNFLADDAEVFKLHICSDWQDSEQEAQCLAFTRDVLNSDEPLNAPSGLVFEMQKKRGEVISQEELKTQLKMGRMSYKAHPLGGCTHVGACDKQKGLRLTSGICVSENCKSLIGKHSSILKIIPIQQGFVNSLDPDSIAFAMENEELDILIAAEIKWNPSTSTNATLTKADHVVPN